MQKLLQVGIELRGVSEVDVSSFAEASGGLKSRGHASYAWDELVGVLSMEQFGSEDALLVTHAAEPFI